MTATDAYRAWLAAHPDFDALDDAQKDHEAALAMGWRLDIQLHDDGWEMYGWWTTADGKVVLEREDYYPTTDAAQAVELAQATAEATGWRVRVSIDSLGASAHAPFGNMPVILDVPDYPHSAGSFPAALTTACLDARRAMMEMDDG